MNLEDLTLDVEQSIEMKADIGDVFKRTLYRFGEGNLGPDGTSLNLILEEWAGGRWFRDRGDGIQHLWGHVQVIKPPALLELCGPMFMSYAAISHVQYRFTPEGEGVRLKLTHRAMGCVPADLYEGVNEGWDHSLRRVREIASRRMAN